MVVRASFAVRDIDEATRSSRALCEALQLLGACEVIRLEPYYKRHGEYIEYVNVAVDRSGDPGALIRRVAASLVSGDWDFHESNPDEAWAVWDVRRGGTPVPGSMTWACIELLPP